MAQKEKNSLWKSPDEVKKRTNTTERRLAYLLFNFVAKFEEELLGIWNKPRVILRSAYVITLDRIYDRKPELLKQIFQHPRFHEQVKEWQELGMVDESFTADALWKTDPTGRHLHARYRFLPLDTRYFKDLELEILALFDNLDEALDGWLVKSENYQALNTMLLKFRDQVKCIYIDPPYNTGADNDFLYKDNYRHSSWLSMMFDRMVLARELAAPAAGIFVSTDDREYANLRLVLGQAWGDENFVADVIWNSRKSVSNDALISVATNHTTFFAASKAELDNRKASFRLPQDEEGFENPDNDPRGPWKLDPMDAPNVRPNLTYPIKNPYTGEEIFPPEGRCWRFEQWQTEQLLREGRIVFGRSGKAKPMFKRFLSEAKEKGRTPTTLWDDVKTTTDATKLLLDLFGAKISRELINGMKPKPKELIERIVTLLTDGLGTVLDYFAGSGTTGHAVINLNREDGGRRKFILVEMGDYFDKVLVPRIKKVIFTPEWKDGKAQQDGTGISHFVKYYELEQYEDSLRRTRYLDNGLFTPPPTEDPCQYLFLRDLKMLEALGINLEQGTVKVDLSKLYPDIDLAETLSNLTGKWIKRIHPDPDDPTKPGTVELTDAPQPI